MLIENLLRRPDDPDEQITCDYGRKRKGDADLHEVSEAYFVAFLAEHADTGDVG